MSEWIACRDRLPDPEVVVETKIDDERGERNIGWLVLSGRLWWLPDRAMYVYYWPTHWRPIQTSAEAVRP